MRNLIHFISKNHFVLLFILLEILCFLMIGQSNHRKGTAMQRFSTSVTGKLYEGVSYVTDYVKLSKINEQLLNENVRIHNKNKNLYFAYERNFEVKSDTVRLLADSVVYVQQYRYTPAIVVNNTVSKGRNFFTVNKGSRHGIKPDMAVISDMGVAGVVYNVSENFASVISLLNEHLRVSGKLKKNDQFGVVAWDGGSSEYAQLLDIPRHVKIEVGDTVMTTGFSSIFPEGIALGTVSAFKPMAEGSFYEITLRLATNFQSLNYVYLIDNVMRTEQLELEMKNEND